MSDANLGGSERLEEGKRECETGNKAQGGCILCMRKLELRSTKAAACRRVDDERNVIPRHRSEIPTYARQSFYQNSPRGSRPDRLERVCWKSKMGLGGILEATLEGKWAGPWQLRVPISAICVECTAGSVSRGQNEHAVRPTFGCSRMTLRAKVCEWWAYSQCQAFAQTQSRWKSGGRQS
jgi:hypothetical protein